MVAICGPVSTKSARRSEATVSARLPRIVAARKPTELMSASASVSANAVAAERRGLRRVLVPASLPTAPNGPPNTFARIPPTGTIRPAANNQVPTMTSTAPSPTRVARVLVDQSSTSAPASAAAAPASRNTAPVTVRFVSGAEEDRSPERMASMGATRPARFAGVQEETMVTITPTATGMRIDRASTPTPASGKPKDMASMPACSSFTRPAPTRMPSSEPTRPMIAASASTAVVNCEREAPSARSRPNSLVRCATIIAKVLEMMNVPTSRAIRPKARRK